MIATDSSSLIAYLNGETTPDTELLDKVLSEGTLMLPPFVISEVLSAKNITKSIENVLSSLPVLSIHDDFWFHVGKTRSLLLSKNLKAKLIDTMIAQICIDHNIPLITRDADFRHYQKYCGLRLLLKYEPVH